MIGTLTATQFRVPLASPVSPSLDDDYFSVRKLERYVPHPSTADYQYLLYRMKLLLIIKNFSGGFEPSPSEILPQLYISDLYTATSPQILDDLGITHILSVKSRYTLLPFGEGRFKRMCISMEDCPDEHILSYLEKTTRFIQKALSRSDGVNARVLVHCDLGKSGSAALVLGYLIAVQYMSFDAALAFLKTRRSIVEPNSGFERQLRQWEAVIRSKLELTLERGLRERLLEQATECG